MTFEQWMQRPVYVVQVLTWRIACARNLTSGHGFRALPGRRSNAAMSARNEVADLVRVMRRDGSCKRAIREVRRQIKAGTVSV